MTSFNVNEAILEIAGEVMEKEPKNLLKSGVGLVDTEVKQ